MSDRRITSTDVAREAGVSRATISYVLNDDPRQRISPETRERVLDAARRLGYQPFGPARLLRGGQSRLVLMITAVIEEGLDPVGASIVERLRHELRKVGLQLVWQLGVAGAPAPATDLTPRVVLSSAVQQYSVDADSSGPASPPVLPAFPGLVGFLGGATVAQVDYLAAQGHSRLIYAAPSQPELQPTSDVRWQAMRRACRRLHLPPPTCIQMRPDRAGAGEQLTGLLDRANPPTGVCAYNDTVASVVLAAALDRGIAVPGDLAVIGVDALPWGEMLTPPLTTVRADLDEFIQQMADNVARVADGKPSSHVLLPRLSQVVVRRSS